MTTANRAMQNKQFQFADEASAGCEKSYAAFVFCVDVHQKNVNIDGFLDEVEWNFLITLYEIIFGIL